MDMREIDCIIAKKAMNHYANFVPKEYYDKYYDDYFRVPRYTEDIKEAMKVFEKLCDPNRTYIMPCGNGRDGLWWAIYYQEIDGDKMIISDKSLPMAICKYALYTLNINIEGEKNV